jgi:hypothetical protein
MAGQSAGHKLEMVHANIAAIRGRGGVSADETSAIGGMGRKGGAAEGPEIAPHKNIADEFMAKMGSGTASTGVTGYNSGHGKTF